MSLQKGKTDADLGYKVEEYLKSKGVHTPTLIDPLLKKEEYKIKKIEKLFTSIMEVLGLDLNRKPKPRAQASKEQNDLLELRRIARDEGNYGESDRLRDLLKSQGIEVRDNPDGQSWSWLI